MMFGQYLKKNRSDTVNTNDRPLDIEREDSTDTFMEKQQEIIKNTQRQESNSLTTLLDMEKIRKTSMEKQIRSNSNVMDVIIEENEKYK
jgi:hypothetical protein